MGMCLLFKVLFVAVWTWFLNFLCTQGYTTISWILVLLPFIMFILMILLAYEVFKRVKDTKEGYGTCSYGANCGIQGQIKPAN
jgi:hypothetical protein